MIDLRESGQQLFDWAQSSPAPAPELEPAAPNQTMAERYAALVPEMKARYGFRVRKWRTSMSGCAWEVHYVDGRVTRLLESPYPKGPMSCAVFLHEVGHHANGLGCCKPVCLEEYYAWKWSLDTMRERGFNVTDAVERRMRESLAWAVARGMRRGLKHIPDELVQLLAPESASTRVAVVT